jgi:integrase/recombinase XerC
MRTLKKTRNDMAPELLGYLQFVQLRIAAATYQGRYWILRAFFNYLVAKNKKSSDVTQTDVEEYLQTRKATQQSKVLFCSVIHDFYEYLKRYHTGACLVKNPAEIAFKPDKSVRLFKVPSQETMDEIFSRLSGANDKLSLRNRLLIELAYGSGLRRSELIRLNIEDIDSESGTLYVLGKGDKPRVVPITAHAMETIHKYISLRKTTRGPLFVTFFGTRLHSETIRLICHQKAGMKPHLLRHACATHMLKNCCDLRFIQDLLGHTRLSTTYIYTAVDKTTLQEVINRNHPRTENH